MRDEIGVLSFKGLAESALSSTRIRIDAAVKDLVVEPV
jgi:hypothetical protein